jgi:hypothetical protein
MTDRYDTLTVVLEHDIRTDDAKCLIDAIRMLRGVLTVQGQVADAHSLAAEHRARWDLRNKLLQMIDP